MKILQVLLIFFCLWLQAPGQNISCGGLQQSCCCDTTPILLDPVRPNAAKIMVGMPAQEQEGCCSNDKQVCIGTKYSRIPYSNIGQLSDYKCYPRSLIKDRTYIEQNANYQGELILNTPLFEDNTEACAEECEQNEKCNAFVYCSKEGGCANADIDVMPYRQCDLKFQERVLKGELPGVWVRGKGQTDFTSGFTRRGVVIEDNANYKSDFIILEGTQNKQPSAQACSESCQNIERCNAFVYCSKPEGCKNANVNIIEYQSCDLKFQFAIAQGAPPEVWVRGSDIDFTSGYVNRTIPCGYGEGAPCCPSSALAAVVELGQREPKLPGGCNSESLYCDYSARDEESELGYCKQAERSSLCGSQFGVCGCDCDDFIQECPDGFSCAQLPYNGIPGYSIDGKDIVFTDYCVENPTSQECGAAGQMCCPYNAQDAPVQNGIVQVNAECNDEEGLVCVGADAFYHGTCVDYNECGQTDGPCCPNLYGKVIKGTSDSYSQCKGIRAYCDDNSVCQLNAEDCGQGGASCCYSSPSVATVPPQCSDGYFCDEAANQCIECNEAEDNAKRLECKRTHCVCRPAGCNCVVDSF
eukprot:TRINITY_DN3459_c0_g1_i2.p2 TRINITY_DN3459_c0_g1~~TRINITY_DN3459_c0_g1_i2.p2  ORF type:complete len:610 (-),score=52.31 TRINITY_DN3459_c0_g1_i2:3704-5449(-)